MTIFKQPISKNIISAALLNGTNFVFLKNKEINIFLNF